MPPSVTNIFSPEIVAESPVSVASTSTPSASQRPLASASAKVAMISPEAIPSSSSSLAFSLPECKMALPASTTVEK